VARGEKPPMWLDPARAAAIRGPVTVDGMGPTEGWEAYWKEFDEHRRKESSWAAKTRSPLVA
jgi:phthalate 4,5-dioxygenase oxygenase subunit